MNWVCLEDDGVLACMGYLFDTVKSVSDNPQEAILFVERIGRLK